MHESVCTHTNAAQILGQLFQRPVHIHNTQYVTKPQFHPHLNGFRVQLTGVRTQNLSFECYWQSAENLW